MGVMHGAGLQASALQMKVCLLSKSAVTLPVGLEETRFRRSAFRHWDGQLTGFEVEFKPNSWQ
ncbi:hypothetical protein DJICPGNB_07905 [Escherichia coli]|nr:hypothetical protein DJICPGNB_07905 [Escherichia coli]